MVVLAAVVWTVAVVYLHEGTYLFVPCKELVVPSRTVVAHYHRLVVGVLELCGFHESSLSG